MRTVQRDTNWCIAIVSAMICKWCRSTVVKKELSMDMKLSIYRSTYVPTLTNYYQLADTSGRNQLPPKSISALPLRHVEEVDCSGGAEIKAANPPHWNEPGKGMPDVHFLRWGKVLSGNGLGIDPGHIRARCWVRELINYSSQYTLLLSLHSYKRGRQEVRNNRGGEKKKKKKAPQKPNPQDKMLWFALHVSPPQQWTTSVLHTESRKDFNSKKQQEEIYCE